jgi:hypothetical protein
MNLRLIGVLFAAAAGCGGAAGLPDGNGNACPAETPSAIPVGDAPAMNNAATLQGPPVGLGSFEGSCQVRRRVPVVVSRAGEGLAFNGQAFLLRASPQLSGAVTAIVPVQNEGATIVCSGQSITVSLMGAGGAVISSEPTDLVGSVATFPVVGTNDCLGPGESGFVQGGALDLQRPFYDEIVQVEISVGELYAATTRPGGSLVPKSYALTNSLLTVTYENVSAFAARTGGGGNLGYVLLLDADDLPVYSGSFDLAPEETIQPGATGTITHDYLPYFPGRVTRLRAFLQFE